MNQDTQIQQWNIEDVLRNVLMSHVSDNNAFNITLRNSSSVAPIRLTNETLIRVHLIPYSSEDELPIDVLERCRKGLKRKHKRDKHVNHLPPYQKINNELLNTLPENCPICYEAYKNNEYIRELPLCHHSFHKKCIDKWLRFDRNRMSCPMCRVCHCSQQ